MSLLSDIEDWYKNNDHPPEGAELDEELLAGKWVSKGTSTERVSWETLDTSGRWGNAIQIVYKRGEELIAVSDMEPATEMQDWGDYGKPEIYPVRPIEVTVIKYVKVDS